MNVLQLTPELNAGGVERTTLEVAEGLINTGHTAHVVSAGGRMENELIQMGAHLHRMDIGSKNIFTYGARVSALKKIIKAHKIDIVHARSRAPAWPALKAAKTMGVPFLATYHGIYNAKSALKRRYNAVMTKGPLTIANSNMTKAHIIDEHGLDPEHIIVIPRGVDLSAFDPSEINADDIRRVRISWGVKPSDYVLLLPGRLTEWKGQRIAIDAMSADEISGAAKNTHLIIMGDAQGRQSYVETLKALVREHALDDNIHFTPHSPNMPLMLAACDCVLSTSIEPEAFGRVAIEAGAMGKPVIATAHGGTLETVIPEQTGLWVTPADSRELSQTIKAAMNWQDYDPVFARNHVIQHFSKRQLQDKTLAVYQRLLSIQ